jgi:hypothetical protein
VGGQPTWVRNYDVGARQVGRVGLHEGRESLHESGDAFELHAGSPPKIKRRMQSFKPTQAPIGRSTLNVTAPIARVHPWNATSPTPPHTFPPCFRPRGPLTSVSHVAMCASASDAAPRVPSSPAAATRAPTSSRARATLANPTPFPACANTPDTARSIASFTPRSAAPLSPSAQGHGAARCDAQGRSRYVTAGRTRVAGKASSVRLGPGRQAGLSSNRRRKMYIRRLE